MKYIKKPIPVEAAQWFKNGDHPDDYKNDFEGVAKQNNYEGEVVRRFRRPDVEGLDTCRKCGKTMHEHGWIDTLEGGHIVCPGDWIITGVKGERYPCKPDIFQQTYEVSISIIEIEKIKDVLIGRIIELASRKYGHGNRRLGCRCWETAALNEDPITAVPARLNYLFLLDGRAQQSDSIQIVNKDYQRAADCLFHSFKTLLHATSV